MILWKLFKIFEWAKGRNSWENRHIVMACGEVIKGFENFRILHVNHKLNGSVNDMARRALQSHVSVLP